MSSLLHLPISLGLLQEAHEQWVRMLKNAEDLLQEDNQLQFEASRGWPLKGRNVPPEVLGGLYAKYCKLLNDLYHGYLNNLQLQKAPYITEIINVLVKRIGELREELVHIIVNDYIYVDGALIQNRMTPYDIEIMVPYHYPRDFRTNDMEEMYKQMIFDANWKKLHPPKPQPSLDSSLARSMQMFIDEEAERGEVEDAGTVQESEHTEVTEDFIHALVIQKHERFRKFFIRDHESRAKERRRLLALTENVKHAPGHLRRKAVAMIVHVYRLYMEIKRTHLRNIQRDVLLGLLPDIDKRPLKYVEENNKMYEHRREKREALEEGPYAYEHGRRMTKMLFLRGGIVDDVTEYVIEWFRDWYENYGFFPQYPYVEEGGTIIVINGKFNTVEQQKEADLAYAEAIKGKTPDQIASEKKQAEADAKRREVLLAEMAKKDALALLKARCNPETDPGYTMLLSETTDEVTLALRNYYQAWSFFDQFPVSECKNIVYGFMIPLIDEVIREKMHLEIHKYVDSLMRLELKVLIEKQKADYKTMGLKYPKVRPRRKPKVQKVPKPIKITKELIDNIESVFEFELTSRPTVKFCDIAGDLNFVNYNYNIEDPTARFPPPAYGDVKRRLTLSCIFGAGMESKAQRNKAVLLLGIPRNGKSFLVDTVAGELNAVKIDITAKLLSTKTDRPSKLVTYAFLAARVFQPAVVFMRDVDKLFAKKVPPEEQLYKAKTLAKPLYQALKALPVTDKVIFIATCSDTLNVKGDAMVKMFDEVILVPRVDYGSAQLYFSQKLLTIRSMPRDYEMQCLAYMFVGYGFGILVEAFNKVMCAKRICRLNITPLHALEFLDYLMAKDYNKLPQAEYQEQFVDFFIENSYLKTERIEYAMINSVRKEYYDKLEAAKSKGKGKKGKKGKKK